MQGKYGKLYCKAGSISIIYRQGLISLMEFSVYGHRCNVWDTRSVGHSVSALRWMACSRCPIVLVGSLRDYKGED